MNFRNDSGYSTTSDRSSDTCLEYERYDDESYEFDPGEPKMEEIFCTTSSPGVRLCDSAASLSAGSTNDFTFDDFDYRVKCPEDNNELAFNSFHAGVTNNYFPNMFFNNIDVDVMADSPHYPESTGEFPAAVKEEKVLSLKSACVTNFTENKSRFYKITLQNLDKEFSNIIKSSHITDRFKIKSDKRCQTKSLVDLLEEDFKEILQNGSIVLSKLPKNEKREKFASIKKSHKRSLASCQSIPKGLALAEKWGEIQKKASLDQKSRNNQFSNYQRKDRKTGAKLEDEFLKRNCLSKFSSYEDMEDRLQNTLLIFDTAGFVKYISKKFSGDIVPFYEGYDDIFFIKNLKGFARIDNRH